MHEASHVLLFYGDPSSTKWILSITIGLAYTILPNLGLFLPPATVAITIFLLHLLLYFHIRLMLLFLSISFMITIHEVVFVLTACHIKISFGSSWSSWAWLFRLFRLTWIVSFFFISANIEWNILNLLFNHSSFCSCIDILLNLNDKWLEQCNVVTNTHSYLGDGEEATLHWSLNDDAD